MFMCSVALGNSVYSSAIALGNKGAVLVLQVAVVTAGSPALVCLVLASVISVPPVHVRNADHQHCSIY